MADLIITAFGVGMLLWTVGGLIVAVLIYRESLSGDKTTEEYAAACKLQNERDAALAVCTELHDGLIHTRHLLEWSQERGDWQRDRAYEAEQLRDLALATCTELEEQVERIQEEWDAAVRHAIYWHNARIDRLEQERDEALAHCSELKERLDFWHDAFTRVRRQRDSWHKAWIRALKMVNEALQERTFIRAALLGLLEEVGKHDQESPQKA